VGFLLVSREGGSVPQDGEFICDFGGVGGGARNMENPEVLGDSGERKCPLLSIFPETQFGVIQPHMFLFQIVT